MSLSTLSGTSSVQSMSSLSEKVIQARASFQMVIGSEVAVSLGMRLTARPALPLKSVGLSRRVPARNWGALRLLEGKIFDA